MKTSLKNKIICILLAVVLFGLSGLAVFRPKDEYSASERRLLAQMPAVSVKTLLSGTFMSEFEEYTLDQFPLRESWRTLKALANKYVYNKSENNGIYELDGYFADGQYPLDEKSMAHAVKVFNSVYDRYFADGDYNVYFSLIPDKNFFMQEQAGQLCIDYDRFKQLVQTELSRFSYIEIFDTLTLDAYYKTDTHWRQEKIQSTADRILSAMSGENAVSQAYEIKELNVPFYGVYYGQAALPVDLETIFYADTDRFTNVKVYDHENRKEIGVYDFEKAEDKDPYEFFLSGPLSLVTIENPDAATDRELFLFRDSFGSSIAPYFIDSHAKITLIDIRYLASSMVGNFVEFPAGADVLFLYSTMVLNASNVLK